MALIVTDPRGPGLDETQRYHLYCCNDSMGTREVFDVIYPNLDEFHRTFYQAQMAFQSPTLAMTLRGTLVDEQAREEAIELRSEEERVEVEKLRKHPEIQRVWDRTEAWD